MSKLRTRRPPCMRRTPRGAVSAERRRLALGASSGSAVSKLRACGYRVGAHARTAQQT